MNKPLCSDPGVQRGAAEARLLIHFAEGWLPKTPSCVWLGVREVAVLPLARSVLCEEDCRCDTREACLPCALETEGAGILLSCSAASCITRVSVSRLDLSAELPDTTCTAAPDFRRPPRTLADLVGRDHRLFRAVKSHVMHRSYLTPVRDEEAESLRKARSRQARQTRRSTQGVTLTDLQEAERTFSRSRAERQAQEQPSPKPVGPRGLEGSAQKHEPLAAPAEEAGESRQPWDRSLEDQPVYRRLRCPAQPDKPTTPVSPPAPRPSLYTSSYLLRTEGEEADLGDQSSNRLSIRERRRPKERRRGTGINFWTKDVSGLSVLGHLALPCAARRPVCRAQEEEFHTVPRIVQIVRKHH
ncbi:hypothetical protein J1605_013485 [Eschrichtius robustus]|uniref:Uncharacterized protein n=1 Tax=Eschrichtius robustus TaxID=9764 RepID=A0AB34GFV0_ESCRO|nr:hypothetical protein J1605_013485 [Eschrichtius robustus]